MPVVYFKCQCGVEHRAIVPIDHTQDTLNERTGRWEYDPSKKHLKSPTHYRQCAECGAVLQEREDPKGVATRFNFNYFGDS